MINDINLNLFRVFYICSKCNSFVEASKKLCVSQPAISKQIKNVDKNLNFEILCNDDYRYILNKDPVLNDYSKVNVSNNTKFRYLTFGQTKEEINNSIECFKKNNYYKELTQNEFWKNSYECNLFEGKE